MNLAKLPFVAVIPAKWMISVITVNPELDTIIQ